MWLRIVFDIVHREIFILQHFQNWLCATVHAYTCTVYDWSVVHMQLYIQNYFENFCTLLEFQPATC
jgi:hypothetical protein